MIPGIVRADRGPEMTSKANEEFSAILGVQHRKGAALTPRRQRPGGRVRQTILKSRLLLMSAVSKAFPQEWASLAPTLEYLGETAPREPHGLSAFDFASGCGLLTSQQRQMAPFTVPRGMPETDVAAQRFANFKERAEFS